MKNKVILALAAAISIGIAGCSVKTQAMTTAYESEDGTIKYRISSENGEGSVVQKDIDQECTAQEDIVAEYTVQEDIDQECTAQEDVLQECTDQEDVAAEYTPQELAEKNENFRKQENKDSLAFLKEFGVTYDTKKDAVYYGKEKVRWLIDEKPLGNSTVSYYTKGGTIDVYTVRDKDGAITGVRKATKKEFDQREEQKNPEVITGTVMELAEDSAAVNTDLPSEYKEQMEKKEEEYAKIGIGKDEDGCWTWKGKKVYLLLDYDGGLTVFGSEKAKKDKIYLYVSRDEDGNVLKAEAVSAVEILEKKALQDAEKDG